MYAWETLNLYCQYHPRWFEASSRYAPGGEHLAVYRALMPSSWPLHRRGLWYIADPPGTELPVQGWKLHVSARPEQSARVLRAALPVLRDANVHFKFLLDPASVALTSSKLFPRGSSGKFITVYPDGDDRFRAVAAALTDVLADVDGPYILSDRRCPGSRAVYYRYGGFQGISTTRPDGVGVLHILQPDGTPVPDVRHPYWHRPDWVTDPFGQSDADADDGGDGTLAGGRFTVTSAVGFSNRGGVYRGIDNTTGAEVIIKEARPNVRVGSIGADVVQVLEKEYQILCALADTGHYVTPVAFFTEWEHAFLVEEAIDGRQLSQYSIATNPVYSLDLTATAVRDYLDRMRALWVQVAAAIDAAHRRGILLGDLSFTNVMVDAGDTRARIIDLEAAVRDGTDPELGLYTVGLSSPRTIATGRYDRANDYHALGALMLGSLAVVNNAIGYHRPALPRFLASLSSDLDLPPELTDLIGDLMDPDSEPDAAGIAAGIADRLAALPLDEPRSAPPLGRPAVAPGQPLRDQVEHTVAEVARYLVGTADPSRTDRLFPADLLVFESNPLSVAHGACGVLHALHRLGRQVPPHLLGWVLAHEVGNDAYPPGLYLGQSGIAWVLDELGHPEVAARLLRQVREHPLLATMPAGVLHGTAGVGMAALRLWRRTGEPEFLDDAIRIGERLDATAVRDGRGAHWPEPDGVVRIGYGHGAAGVALFLLYLHLATTASTASTATDATVTATGAAGAADATGGDGRWYTLGRAGLDHDLSHATPFSERVLAFPARSGDDPDRPGVLHDYWDQGTAGVLTSALRYHAHRPDPALAATVATLLPDACRRYSVLPQLFHGLSGLGNVVLDAYEFTGDPALLAEAWRVAGGVLLFRVEGAEGTGFPGEQAVRESADLASGAAGVGLFLHRLAVARPGARSNANFLLDELLPPGSTPLSAVDGAVREAAEPARADPVMAR